MQSEDRSAVERGMQRVVKLPDIMPDQASDRIRPIYDDIKQVLRVPIVNLIFRTLANYPDYLQLAWSEIRPVARSNVFERAADALRTGALLEPAPGPLDMDLNKVKDMEHLRSFNDTIHYVLPKLLLIATAWADGSAEHPVPERVSTSSPTIPFGVAEGTAKAELIKLEQAGERMHALLEQVKQRHGDPVASSYYRGLANWPDFLEAAWKAIAPRVNSAEYEARKRSLAEAAQNHVRAWGAGSANGAPGEQGEIGDILAAFRLNFIPEMLIDVAMIKSLLDGPEAARTSRFSAE